MFKHFHFFLQHHPSTTLFAMLFMWRSKRRLMLKPWWESCEGALTLSLHWRAQNNSRPSFNYCSPPSESSQCQTVSVIMKTNAPYSPDLSAQTAGVQRKEGICVCVCECVYGVHGGCMWRYVAGVTFLHQLLLISSHSRHLKFRSRRDVVGFRGWSEGVFLCVSLTRDRYSKYTYYLHHKANSRLLGRIQPASITLYTCSKNGYFYIIMLQIHCGLCFNPLWSVVKLH